MKLKANSLKRWTNKILVQFTKKKIEKTQITNIRDESRHYYWPCKMNRIKKYDEQFYINKFYDINVVEKNPNDTYYQNWLKKRYTIWIDL